MARSKHTPAANGGKWIAKSTRWAIYHRDGFRCVYCTTIGGRLTLDHLDPVRVGGRLNTPECLVTACHACNSDKRDQDLDSWLLARFGHSGRESALFRIRVLRFRGIDREIGRFLARRV